MSDPLWLPWARRIAAIAQNGLTYAEGVFDRERYLELREIATAMMSAYGGTSPERIEALFAAENGYATPKVDARAVVFEAEKILLVREKDDKLWSLPGGWVDAGMALREATEKEVREETGYIVRATKILAVHERDRHGAPPLPWAVLKIFVLCELLGGDPAASVETEEPAFFGEREIPSLSLGRVMPAQIQRMFEHRRNPDWPTDFD